MLSKLVMLAALLGGILGSLTAQSNVQLDALLEQAPAHLDSALYLLLASVALVSEDDSPAAAFSKAVTDGLVDRASHPNDPVTIQALSFLLMKTQKMPGGLEWTLFPNPRSAYRELAYRDLINTSAGPDRTVAGDEVVRVLNAVRAFKRVAP